MQVVHRVMLWVQLEFTMPWSPPSSPSCWAEIRHVPLRHCKSLHIISAVAFSWNSKLTFGLNWNKDALILIFFSVWLLIPKLVLSIKKSRISRNIVRYLAVYGYYPFKATRLCSLYYYLLYSKWSVLACYICYLGSRLGFESLQKSTSVQRSTLYCLHDVRIPCSVSFLPKNIIQDKSCYFHWAKVNQVFGGCHVQLAKNSSWVLCWRCFLDCSYLYGCSG